MSNKKLSNCIIAVSIGDLVRVEFSCPTKTCVVRVKEVEIRYGRVSRGTRTQNPLIIGVDIETNEREVFDASFVQEILERSSSRILYPKKNIFLEISDSLRVNKKGGLWIGTLHALAVKALAELPYEFDRPLNERRLINLYSKSGVGCKDRNYPYVTVDRRKFCRWVSKNYSRIVKTSKEYGNEMTRENQYWDMLHDMVLDEESAE